MDNLINETNARIQEIIDNLMTIKEEYEGKLSANMAVIDEELRKVNTYKKEFFTSKEKIEKMNADIEGFEEDYKNLVDRFKDDELANILIAANKEISAKIDERKRKIVKDKTAMNELVEKAENVKKKLVKLTAEKKALELCLDKINDSCEFYSKSLGQIIDYSRDNRDFLCACYHEDGKQIVKESVDLDISSISIEEETFTDDELLLDDNLEEIDTTTFDDEELISEDTIEEIIIDEDIHEDIIHEDSIYDEELVTVDLDEIPEISISEIDEDNEFDSNDDEDDNSTSTTIGKIEEKEDTEDKEDYDFNASLDLENIINEDSLDEEDKNKKNKKKNDK